MSEILRYEWNDKWDDSWVIDAPESQEVVTEVVAQSKEADEPKKPVDWS